MSTEREQRRLFRRAMRTGQAPAGLDGDRWLPVVRRRATLLRLGRPAQAALWSVVLAMLVLVVVLGLLGPVPVLVWFGTVMLALSVTFALLLDRVWVRATRSVEALLSVLERAERR
ncbi:hypothetical protein GCM10008944_12940 [Cytobacillus oceanisediminis]